MSRIKAVFYQYRYFICHSWLHGSREYDFSTEMGYFHRFVVRQLFDALRFFYKSWIGGHNAIHIRPYFDSISFQSGTYNGGCIIGATASKSSCLSMGRTANKAGNHIQSCVN